MAEQLSNLVKSSLNGSIDSTQTTITLTDGSLFPSTGNFRVACENEIMLCTSRSGNVLTVNRGQEGTSGASHSSGQVVAATFTKGSFSKFLEEFHSTGTYASRPTGSYVGQMFYPTDTPWITHCRFDGTNWISYHHGLQLTNPLAQTWSWHNQGSATVTEEKESFLITSPDTTYLGPRGRMKAVPTAPYKITSGVVWFQHTFVETSDGGYEFGWLDNASGKYTTISPRPSTSAGLQVNNYNSSFAFDSGVAAARAASFPRVTWWQLEDDNTNRYFRFSMDGVFFEKIVQVTRTTYITPTHFMVAPIYFGSIRLIHYKEE